MVWAALVSLGIALGYAIFHSGGVDPAHWNPTLAGVGSIGALYFLRRSAERPGLDRLTIATLVGLVVLSVLQLAPVPVAWIRWLSPLRYEDLQAATLVHPLPAYAPVSSAPAETAQYLLTLGGCLVTLLLVRAITLDLRAHYWVVVWPLLLLGVAEAMLGFFQAYAPGGEGLARGTYASRDHYAALLEMILPFAVLYPAAILQRSRNRHESPALPALIACLPLACGALLLTGIIHSLSRGGFLSTLGSLLVCGALAFALRPNRPGHRPVGSALWRKGVPISIVALTIALGFVYLPTDPLIARFSDLAQTEDISADTRAQIWRDTAGMVPAYRFLGTGWGAYQYAFLRFKTVAPMQTVDYAHNDYLQILVEAGPIIFVLGLWLLVRILLASLRAASSASPDNRSLAIACAGSFTAILLHSFVDFNLYVPANSLLFAWIAGIGSAHLRAR